MTTVRLRCTGLREFYIFDHQLLTRIVHLPQLHPTEPQDCCDDSLSRGKAKGQFVDFVSANAPVEAGKESTAKDLLGSFLQLDDQANRYNIIGIEIDIVCITYWNGLR
jgi:hypothetical protein